MGKGKVEVAESLWNNNELAKNLYVDKVLKGTGATISIVGFKEDLYEYGHEGHEIFKDKRTI